MYKIITPSLVMDKTLASAFDEVAEERLDLKSGNIYYAPIQKIPFFPYAPDYSAPDVADIDKWIYPEHCVSKVTRHNNKCHECNCVWRCAAPEAAVGRLIFTHPQAKVYLDMSNRYNLNGLLKSSTFCSLINPLKVRINIVGHLLKDLKQFLTGSR